MTTEFVRCRQIICTLLLLGLASVASANIKVKGLVQGRTVQVNGLPSFLNGGTGQLRHDDNDRVELAQALLAFDGNITSTLTYHGIANHVRRPQSFTGFTQLFLRYKPIVSPRYRWQFKAGMFYPEMSLENPDIGWLSPYAYTNSAINSWIGEELRTVGAEVKVTRPGRAHGNSPNTFSAIASVFKGNDTVGTQLAWRGWALHDRQTLLNETLPFANYPSINGLLDAIEPQQPFVEPFREIDGKFGFYLGAHWDYQKTSRLRYYFYDNMGDETILGRDGQYAWRTKFHSVAWQYRFNRQTRFISQWMTGSTYMGPAAINVNFDAVYALLSHAVNQHRFSLRYDWFKTKDSDKFKVIDDNDGDGWGITGAYRYTVNAHWQLGVELLHLDSTQLSRAQFEQQPVQSQNQMMGVVQYRF